MTPDDVRRLARSVPERWRDLELEHRSSYRDFRVTLRHGELDGSDLKDGAGVHVRGAPPSSWTVRPLEPYATNYQWSAMLDPYELGEGVEITDIRREDLFDRPVVTFTARAVAGYDPICSCCPLVFSTVSEQLEHGEGWTPKPGCTPPEHVDLALDLTVGMVVSSHDRDGGNGDWFTNEILRAS